MRRRHSRGKRLVVILAALSLVFAMTAAYMAGLLTWLSGGGHGSQTTTTQTPSTVFCGDWPKANISVSIVPGYKGLEGFIEAKREGERSWGIYIYIRNNGTELAKVPWLASDGVRLVLYNVIGYRAHTETVKFEDAPPVLNPGQVAVAYRSFSVPENAPQLAYALVYSPKTGLILGAWLIDPIGEGEAVACGHYLVEGEDYRILERWVQLRFGLVVFESVLESRGDLRVAPGSPSFDVTIYDDGGKPVLKIVGPREQKQQFIVPAGTFYVMAAGGTYSIGQPHTIEAKLNYTLNGEEIPAYSGSFASDGFRELRPGVWVDKTYEITNGSIAILVEASYNGYLLAIRNVTLVGVPNSTLLVPEDFKTASILFGVPMPGAVIELDYKGNSTGYAVYIAPRIGGPLKAAGSKVISNKTYYVYVIRDSSIEFNKMLGNDLASGAPYTIFYAPAGMVEQLRIYVPWGTYTLRLPATG